MRSKVSGVGVKKAPYKVGDKIRLAIKSIIYKKLINTIDYLKEIEGQQLTLQAVKIFSLRGFIMG